MAVTASGFKGRFAAYCDVTNVRAQIFLDMAGRRFNDECFTDLDLADDAHYYLAAHLLAVDIAGATGISGAVTTKKVGDIQVSFAAGSTAPSATAALLTTSYGRQFLSILSSLALTPFVL